MTFRIYGKIIAGSAALGLLLSACNPVGTLDAGMPETDLQIYLTAEPGGWTAVYNGNSDSGFVLEQTLSKDLPAANPSECPAEVSNPILLPVNQTASLNITASHTLTGLCVPAFGIKTDAVPGRINQTWVKPMITERYCGRCLDENGDLDPHSAIVIDVISMQAFKKALTQNNSAK